MQEEINWNKVLAKEAIKRIVPVEEYSQGQVLEKQLIPWAKHQHTLKRIIERGVLKVRKDEGVSNYGDRITILGSDIISYIKKYSGLS